jgi:hypothetical protein
MEILMKCGHSANSLAKPANYVGEPIPACVICGCFDIAEVEPNLVGRRARCTYYGHPVGRRGSCDFPKETRSDVCKCEGDSNSDHLPFFRYKGEGSEYATSMCTCGYYRSAHKPVPFFDTGKRFPPRLRECILGRGFTPVGPAEFDEFYCGCACGWD